MREEVIIEFLQKSFPQWGWYVEWNANTGYFKVRVERGVFYGERLSRIDEVAHYPNPAMFLYELGNQMAQALSKHIAEKTGDAPILSPVEQIESDAEQRVRDSLNEFHGEEVV